MVLNFFRCQKLILTLPAVSNAKQMLFPMSKVNVAAGKVTSMHADDRRTLTRGSFQIDLPQSTDL